MHFAIAENGRPRFRAGSTRLDAVLRLLGGVPASPPAAAGEDTSTLIPEGEGEKEEAFAAAEKGMVRDVLALADRSIQTIMTPRPEVIWIDPGDSKESVLAEVRNSAHRQFLVSRGSVDDVVGVARKEDILVLVSMTKSLTLYTRCRNP